MPPHPQLGIQVRQVLNDAVEVHSSLPRLGADCLAYVLRKATK